MSIKTVLYTSAHSGFDLTRVPLGGAATICAQLTKAWEAARPFELRLLGPALLGEHAPKNKDLVHYSEWRYARFCREFESATTQAILQHNPEDVVVLVNDVSEGPDFRQLSEKGYRMHTIYHVDVVDYFARMYLRGAVQPRTLAAIYDRLERSPVAALIPSVLKLIFKKQRDSLLYSRGVIVPSEGMKQTLQSTYPAAAPEKIQVMPWGVPDDPVDPLAVEQKAAELRRRYGIPSSARVVLTLSRISPEKGQDRLLRALALWEKQADFPADGLWVFLCGEAAYMQGERFQRRLKALAAKLRKTRVIFPGYLAGIDKQAYFRLADLYVFPSRHESYGLTLLEAFRAGLPALACQHYGAEGLLSSEFGESVMNGNDADVAEGLMRALRGLLKDPSQLKSMGQRARAFAEGKTFSRTARQLADLLLN